MDVFTTASRILVLQVYTRSKATKDLSRKLRGEVNKMYIANGVNDAVWLIEKYNSNPDIPGIS